MERPESEPDERPPIRRRTYLQALAGAGAGSAAGCVGRLERTGPGEAGGSMDLGDSSRIRVPVDNTPEDANFNEWAETQRNAGIGFLTEIAAPVSADDRSFVTSGTTFDAPWIDGREQVSVPAMLADYEIEPPTDAVETYDDRLTYWDGTPLNAEARHLHEKLTWYDDADGTNAANPDATFGGEVVDEWTYRFTGTPSSRPVLEANVFDFPRVPMHPSFTRPYVERLEDATTESAASTVIEDLRQDSISLRDLIEKGWGSGLYRIESYDDVDQNDAIAHVWDEHPIEHAGVDRLVLTWATSSQRAIAAQNGRIDLDGGVVGSAGDLARDALPDHVQQIDRYLQIEGDKLLFNWNDHHLRRLWVRRAVVAIVNWPAVDRQGWGSEAATPVEHDTGLHSTLSETTFSEDFLGSLHAYPRGYDLERATDWLRRAGYTGSRSAGWTGPEGEPLELTITAPTSVPEHVRASRVIEANLESLGVEADVELLPEQPGYANAVGGANPDFQLALTWDTHDEPWKYFWTMGGWWRAPLFGGAADNWWQLPAQGYGERDNYGVPLEPELPARTGSIDAPDRAGRRPDLAAGEQVALPPILHEIRSSEVEEATVQEHFRTCARFYNFYLPQFRFHDTAWGVWGNRRDFEFPPEGHPANRITKGEFSGEDYLLHAGLPQPSPDDDYPELDG